MHYDPRDPDMPSLGPTGADEPRRKRPQGPGFADEIWNLQKHLEATHFGRDGQGRARSTEADEGSGAADNGSEGAGMGAIENEQLQSAQRTLQRLQAAFHVGNITLTDEGMPAPSNSSIAPPDALGAYLHLNPDGDACAAFAAPEVQSIAVVGNGPLSAADVAAADAHDLVVR